MWDGAGGSFGSDASFTSAFRPSAAALDPFQTPTALKNTNTPSAFYTPAAAIELAEAAVASNGGGGGTHAPKEEKGKKRGGGWEAGDAGVGGGAVAGAGIA